MQALPTSSSNPLTPENFFSRVLIYSCGALMSLSSGDIVIGVSVTFCVDGGDFNIVMLF